MDIHVICGGKSSEHDISLRSAKTIINNLDKNKYNVSYSYISKDGVIVPIGFYKNDIVDEFELQQETNKSIKESIKDFIDFIEKLDNPLVIPAIHGTTGEDGYIQGFLSILGLKYLGNSLISSAMCFDKAITNDILALNNIPQAKYYSITKDKYKKSDKEQLFKEIFDKLGDTVFVKPSNNGSSVGVSKATIENIEQAIDEALKYDYKVLIEEEMIGEELEVSVIGNEDPKASLAGSYSTQRDLFDYTAKYLDKALVTNIPHELPEDVSDRVRQLAIDSYQALGCQDFARVDIFMDKDYNFFVNEINTFPGMTPTSLSPALWKVTDNTTYPEFLDKLINYANERYEDA